MAKAKKEAKEPKPLWAAKHSYYCNESNYYVQASETVQEFGSWADFIAAEGDADLDLNMVFRWDWHSDRGEDEGKAARKKAEADPYYRAETLQLSYMGQRKGIYRCVLVSVCRADEPAVRAWLQIRWDYMKKLWAPFA